MSVLRFSGVIGETSEVEVKQNNQSCNFYLNGEAVPGVIKHSLVLGDGVARVVLEIAVKQYSSSTIVEIE